MRIMKVYFDRTFTLNDNGMTTAFTYDLIDQLLTEVRNGYEAEYTYDANGNRLTRTVNEVTEVYEYDDADKLLNVKINNSPVKEYTYDDCGRLIAVGASAGITSLSWDYEDRLIGITYPNQSTNSFGYNGFGARVSKSDSSGTFTFFRAGTSVVSPVLSDGSATYTPGISERRSNNSTYYHSDLKNTTAQTSSNETVSGTNQYDAFGNVIDYSGNWNGPFAYGGAFGYQTDDDSGLMLLGHRYYDSSTGRFLSRDPIGDGSNWFNYCDGNPLGFYDEDGLHRNELNEEPATLYKLVSNKDDRLLKWGITHHEDPNKRHPRIFLKLLNARADRVMRGPRNVIAKIERAYVETNPGPLNKEKWAGKRIPGGGATKFLGKVLKVYFILRVFTEGLDAAASDLVFKDEVEAAAGYLAKPIHDGLRNRGNNFRNKYYEKGDLNDRFLEDYGF